MNCCGRRIWMLLPTLGLYAADIGLTLVGQPLEYWRGGTSLAIDANPLAHFVLRLGPLQFIGLSILWAVVFGSAILRLPYRLAGWVAVVVAIAHAVGASTWLARAGVWGWVLAILYLVIAAQLSRFCWRRAGWLSEKTVASATSDCVNQ